MNTFSQWVHQHNLLLLCVAVVGMTAVFPVIRWRCLRLWLAWLSLTGVSLATLLALHTPAASLSEHRGPDGGATASLAGADPGSDISFVTLQYSEPDLGSVEAIEKMIAAAGKPTLVEVYADHGFS